MSTTPARAGLSGEVRMHLGRPTIFLDGSPTVPFFYALTDVPGGRWSWEDVPAHNVRQFATRVGARLFQFDLSLEHVWREDGTLDLALARQQIAGATAARSDAAVMLRLHVRPPRWWMKRHPEEGVAYLDADAKPDFDAGWNRYIEDDLRSPARTSLGSRRWLDEVGPVVERFLRELAATPEGDALMGVQVAGGVFGEWHEWGFNEHESDSGPAMTARFRAFLRELYRSDDALRAAWHRDDVSLDTAAVPDLAQRAQRGDGYFRIPASPDRPAMDYYRCQHDAVADAILHFARIVKRTWPRPIVTGAFYGYFHACFGRDQAGGHLSPHRLLASRDMDFLCAPSAYYPDAFEVGDVYRSRGLIEACRLHGKLFLDEMDQVVPLKAYFDKDYEASLRESIAKARRNTLWGLTRGSGLWFYDFGPSGFAQGAQADRVKALGVVGWWDDPTLLDDLRRVRDLFERVVTTREFDSAADVLVVGDTDSYLHTPSLKAEPDAISHALVNWGPLGLHRAGVVFDSIYLADLPLVDLARYRAVVFLNTYRMTGEQRRFVREGVAKDGRHLVWCFAPAYTDGERNSDDFVREATGLDLRRVAIDGRAEIACGELRYGVVNHAVSPLYAVHDPDAEVFATYTTNAEPAGATLRRPDHTTHYIALPSWDASLYRSLIARTPAHRYTDADDVVYAGSGIVVLHTKTGGSRTLRLRGGQVVRLDLPEGPATAVIDATSGDRLA